MSANVLELPMTDLAAASAPATAADKNAPFLVPPVICYRDPADVRTIRRQSRLIILAFVIVTIAVIGVVYKAIQKPDRIVVDMSSGRANWNCNRACQGWRAVSDR